MGNKVAPEGGRKVDPDMNGPIKNRGCTDVICCLLFIICFIGMIIVGAYAISRGDPNKLLYPTDSSGNMCGTGTMVGKPNLLYFDMLTCAKMGAAVVTSGCPTPQICVATCPTAMWHWMTLAAQETLGQAASGRTSVMHCLSTVDPGTSSKSVSQLVSDEDCAPYVLPSSSIMGRCVPDTLASAATGAVDKFGAAVNGSDVNSGTKYLAILLNAQEYGMKILQDVRSSWYMILIFMIFAMVFSFIWIIVMRWIAGPMVWITILAFIGLFAFGTYYTINKYLSMKNDPAYAGNISFSTSLDSYTNLSQTWLILGIICGVILFIAVVMFIFLRKRILIAIAIIKEASKAVGAMMFTLFWPLIPFILQMILFGYWIASAMYLASSGTPSYTSTSYTTSNITGVVTQTFDTAVAAVPCDPTGNTTASSICSFIKYGGDQYTIYLQFYQLFMMFWCMNFIVALGQMTLAGAFASYYWAFDKSDLPAFPLMSSLWRSLRYHLGSLAFGSLIIAIIQIIRVMLEYIDYKLRKYDNQVVKFILMCLKCCFWCLEKFMKFINKNAYILIAIYGKNFCTSAKDAFFLILRNIVRVVVIDKVTDFILIIGKLVVVALVGVLAFLFFSGDANSILPSNGFTSYITNYTPTLNFYLVPVIVVIIGTYIIASGFFSVYSMGVDTIFLCFLEDIEKNDGSEAKPHRMSTELMKLVGVKNKSDDKKS